MTVVSGERPGQAAELAADNFMEAWSAWIYPAEENERDGNRMRELLGDFAEAVRAEERGRIAAQLVGIGEIAAMLGVSKQRVHQLAGRPEFPDEFARVTATPLWLRVDVLSYGACRSRTPGPRPAAARLARDSSS